MSETGSQTSGSAGDLTAGVSDPDVEAALAEAQASLAAMQSEVSGLMGGSGLGDLPLPDFATDRGDDRHLELLGDVELEVAIELGRTHMLVEDVLRLQSGSVVELDKLAGDPVDVFVNGRLVARGEVLVLNDNFCIRVSEIVADLEEQARLAERLASGESAAAARPLS